MVASLPYYPHQPHISARSHELLSKDIINNPCLHLGCKRSYYRISDLRRHAKCCHPSASTPKFLCTSSGCRSSKDHPDPQPFFRKDHSLQHIRTCSKAKAIFQLDIKENHSKSIDPSVFVAQNPFPNIALGEADKNFAFIERALRPVLYSDHSLHLQHWLNSRILDVNASQSWYETCVARPAD